jgi:hypothetical protein
MKVIIEFNCANDAFQDRDSSRPFEEFDAEVMTTLSRARTKVERQRRRPPALCTHDEADDILFDTNGNRIGTVRLVDATDEDRAQELIDEGDNLCHDVARFHGQDFENVKHMKHMKWFKYAVMSRVVGAD